jgi:hypothetical protein
MCISLIVLNISYLVIQDNINTTHMDEIYN